LKISCKNRAKKLSRDITTKLDFGYVNKVNVCSFVKFVLGALHFDVCTVNIA